jgi:hypothetical protein
MVPNICPVVNPVVNMAVSIEEDALWIVAPKRAQRLDIKPIVSVKKPPAQGY